MKTQEELTKLKSEYESLNSKLKELTNDELKIVTGGNVGSIGMTYYLETDGNGVWKENETIVTSITAISGVSHPGEVISYKDTFHVKRSVTAIPNEGYSYQTCSFNSNTNTYKALFDLKK